MMVVFVFGFCLVNICNWGLVSLCPDCWVLGKCEGKGGQSGV